MFNLGGSERLLDEGNATEAVTMAGNSTAPTVPIPSPTAPIVQAPTEGNPSKVPSGSTFSQDTSPVAAPVSAPVTNDFSPVSAPATFPSLLTDPPSPTMSGKTTPASQSMSQEIDSFLLNPIHIIIITFIVGVITLLLFWKCCKSWKLRREKQMLRLQSTRVDAVLGDMQMVGMDDYDGDDPELI